jgi:hypothetical protein
LYFIMVIISHVFLWITTGGIGCVDRLWGRVLTVVP